MFANRSYYALVGGLMLRIFSHPSRFGTGILFGTHVLNSTLGVLPERRYSFPLSGGNN